MYFETALAVKAAIVARGPIKDQRGNDCKYEWARPDPRIVDPTSIKLERDTHISLELTGIGMNPRLSRFPLRIGARVMTNGVAMERSAYHPEAKLMNLLVHVRSEGRLAEANVWTAGMEIQRRLRHKDHLKVPVDVYRDQREYLIPSLVLVSGENLGKPDGIVRKEFSFDIQYTVETWLLFPHSVRDTRIVEQVTLLFGESSKILYNDNAVVGM